jgi:hypothetical protein
MILIGIHFATEAARPLDVHGQSQSGHQPFGNWPTRCGGPEPVARLGM